MDIEGILKDLDDLNKKSEISKMELMGVVRQYVNMISSFDLAKLMSGMTLNTEYIPVDFFTKVHKVNVSFVLDMINSVKNTETVYKGNIDKDSLKYSVEFLKDKYKKGIHEDDILMFSIIGNLYHRFIVEKPIHPLNLPFPGNLKIIEKEGQYYCPARKNNLANPIAFCKVCLCRQLEF